MAAPWVEINNGTYEPPHRHICATLPIVRYTYNVLPLYPRGELWWLVVTGGVLDEVDRDSIVVAVIPQRLVLIGGFVLFNCLSGCRSSRQAAIWWARLDDRRTSRPLLAAWLDVCCISGPSLALCLDLDCWVDLPFNMSRYIVLKHRKGFVSFFFALPCFALFQNFIPSLMLMLKSKTFQELWGVDVKNLEF